VVRGYLQRLVEPRAAAREAPPVRAATRSLSPIAEQDPRGQMAAFVDPFEAPAGAAMPDSAASPAESLERTGSSVQSAPPPAPAIRAPAPADPKPAPAPVVQRFLAAPPAAAMPQAPAMPALAPPMPAAPRASLETPHRPQATPGPQPAIASFVPPPLPAVSAPMPAPSAEAPQPRVPASPALPRIPTNDSAPARPLPAPTMAEHALPPPRIDEAPATHQPDRRTQPAPLAEPAPPLPRPKIETLDLTHGEAPRAPQSPTREIIVRERIVAPSEPPKPPSPPPARGPRTAEEASVIGPLGRGGRMRSLLDLALR
jgi:hypothetical protein